MTKTSKQLNSRKHSRKYYEKNKNKEKERSRQYYKKNKDKVKERRKSLNKDKKELEKYAYILSSLRHGG